jgi:hypothetical protein
MPFNRRLFMFLAFLFLFTACLPAVSSSHISNHSLNAPSTYVYNPCPYESIPTITAPSLYRKTCIRENFFQDWKSTRAAHLLRADQLWAERFFSGEIASGFTVATKSGATDVYRSIDAAGETQYVGITKNLRRRASEHLRQKGIDIENIPGLGNLSRSDAKAVEQVLIEFHGLGKEGGTLLNKINSIAKTNPTYADQLKRGAELLKNAGYGGF